MKNKVIKFFQNLPDAPHEQFNKAFELYRNSEGKNRSVEYALNASSFSPRALENLLYDLQKMHGITDVEKVSLQVSENVSTEPLVSSTEPLIPSTEPSGANTEALLSENQDLQDELDEVNSDKEDLENENEDLKDEIESLKVLTALNAKAIRVEFPFLNDKDCPDEFKILMADKITAWNTYVDAQQALERAKELNDLSLTELADLAKIATDNFTENQNIYNELNAYATTGKILGVHPLFKSLALKREVEAMTSDELFKYKNASAKYMSDNKKSLAKAIKAKNTAQEDVIVNRVSEREVKLALVNKRISAL